MIATNPTTPMTSENRMIRTFAPRAVARRMSRLFARTASVTTIGAVIGVLALSATVRAQEQKDTVALKDGKSESGRIKSEEFAGLTLEAKGSRTIEWSQIVPNGITYAGSAEFTTAKDALDNGRYDEAFTQLTELKGDKNLRPVLRQNVLFYLATIAQRRGQCDQAVAEYKALLEAFPKSRYLMEIGEGMVACLTAKKDAAGYAAATKALDDLSAAALTTGVEGGFNSGINVLKARVFEEQGKLAEAKAAYGVAEKAPGVPLAIAQKARLGQARCLIAMKNPTEADGILRKLVTEDAPNAVLAGAWNGIADLTVAEAREKRDTDKFLDALYAYMRGVVQYAPLAGESPAEYKRSLKGAADCFGFLADLEKNDAVKRLNQQRKTERLEQLKKEFPNG